MIKSVLMITVLAIGLTSPAFAQSRDQIGNGEFGASNKSASSSHSRNYDSGGARNQAGNAGFSDEENRDDKSSNGKKEVTIDFGSIFGGKSKSFVSTKQVGGNSSNQLDDVFNNLENPNSNEDSAFKVNVAEGDDLPEKETVESRQRKALEKMKRMQ